MAARTIVTSRPDVFCAVCGRRLLAGERPSRYVADSQPVDVCELCTAQAREAGWRPEQEGSHPEQPALPRERRRSGPLGRLRLGLAARLAVRGGRRGSADQAPLQADRSEHAGSERADAGDGRSDRPSADGSRAAVAAGAAPASSNELAAALDLFNQTAETQRIAGVARTLGAPLLTVRPAPEQGAPAGGASGRYILTAAWEISWYRWELDLHVAALQAQLLASGHDPEELSAEELVGNCRADQRGRLMLLEG